MINFFQTGWRQFRRAPGVSLINVGGLATALTASVFIFLWVANEVTFDKYHVGSDNTYLLVNRLEVDKGREWVWENSPYMLGRAVTEQLPEVEQLARLRPREYDIPFVLVNGEPMAEKASAYVDSTWFDLFSFQFLSGDARAFYEHPRSVILTSSAAKRYLGANAAPGQTLIIDSAEYVLRGIIAPNPSNSSFQFDMYFPVADYHQRPGYRDEDLSWGNFNHISFVKLRKGANPDQVAARVTDLLVRGSGGERDRSTSLLPLARMRFFEEFTSGSLPHTNRKVVYVLASLGVLLLTIACINYINLTTARASARAREVGVRKIMGAGRGRLLLQFVAESVWMSAVAMLLAIVLIILLLPFFNQLADRQFQLLWNQPGWWLILLGTFFGTVVLNSIYPALLLSSFQPMRVFRGASLVHIRDTSLRRVLVVVQFSITIFLVLGTIVMNRQLAFINEGSGHFDRTQVFSLHVPFRAYSSLGREKGQLNMEAMKQQLLAESSIDEVALANQSSLVNIDGSSSGNSNDWDGRPSDFRPPITFIYVDSGFKNILNLEMTEGRWFEDGNPADANNAILNETAVRELGIRQPALGQRFTSQGDTGVIVGIVKDFVYKDMHEKIGPVVLNNKNFYNMSLFVRAVPGRASEALAAAQGIWKRFWPATPIDYRFVEQEFEKLYREDRRMTTLVWIFSGIAIFVSCLGLLGLSNFTAERRKRELGIRKVLGASVTGLVGLLSWELLLLVVVAMLIGMPLAYWLLQRWLQDFAYRIAIAPWTFLLAAVLVLGFAFSVIGFRAIRAARANPAGVLRNE